MDRKFVDEKKVAEILDIAIQTLRNHRQMGVGIPYHKFGRLVRYDLNAVYEFADRHRIEPDRA